MIINIIILVFFLFSIYFTIKYKFMQLKSPFKSYKIIVKDKSKSSYQTFMVLLASHIGTGNIVGITSALIVGGPGSLFWMWIYAIFASILSLIENTLAQVYKEKIDNEFKPRTWLLGILIFIALVIVVILINKIVLVSKERKENSKSLFDIFDKTYNDIEDSKTKVDEEYQKQLEKHNIDSFNSPLELYSGTTIRSNVPNNIDNIISSNKKNSDHIITLCYQNTCTEDENEMRTIKKNFTEKIPTSDPNWFEKTTQYYDIILDYDEAGYVNKITIE